MFDSRLTRILAAVVLPLLLAWGGWSCATDGIGKTYMGREIAPVTGAQGASWLERGERQQQERSDLLIAELGLKPGMVVADIGAGTGYHTRQIAPLVGPAGKVYAVDVQPEMFTFLTDVSKRAGLENIEPILGSVDDAKLPASTVDIALMVDVYHELEYPYQVLESIIRGLKPGGRVVFVEYRGEDASVPIQPLHKMTEAQIRREAAQHALIWERAVADLPWQHMVVFRKK